MNIFSYLRHRELGRVPHGRVPVDFALNKYRSQSLDVSNASDPSFQLDDPFLAIALKDNSMLVASEKGFVRILNTDSLTLTHQWAAHYNAIFDIKWRPGHEQAVSVSGDQSFSLWDLNMIPLPRHENAILGQKSAHLSSIKSLSFQNENVFATGSRDSNISFWDLRCQASAIKVNTIPDAHVGADILPGSSSSSSSAKKASRRKNINSSNVTMRSNPKSSVTAILFQPYSSHLFSAGASDGVIKMWDVRMIKAAPAVSSSKSKIKSSPSSSSSSSSSGYQPVKVFPYCGRRMSGHKSGHGFSSLAFDSCGNIYGSCSDHRIYAYDQFSGRLLSSFSGNMFRVDNFTKIRVVDEYLVSGSVAASSPIWCVSDVKKMDPAYRKDVKPRVTLPHDEEVTAVDVDPVSMSIFTLSDDLKIHKWSLFAKLDKYSDPVATAAGNDVKAIVYEEKEVDIEEMIQISPSSSNNSNSTSSSILKARAILQTSTDSIISLSSPAASDALTSSPHMLRSSRGSPLTTIKDWLTTANSNSPKDVALAPASSQSSQASPAHVTSLVRKRSHTTSKENSQEIPGSKRTSPVAQMSALSLTPGTPSSSSSSSRKKQKRDPKGGRSSSRKISDYFHA